MIITSWSEEYLKIATDLIYIHIRLHNNDNNIVGKEYLTIALDLTFIHIELHILIITLPSKEYLEIAIDLIYIHIGMHNNDYNILVKKNT